MWNQLLVVKLVHKPNIRLTTYKEVNNKYIWGELMVNIIPDIKVGNKGTRLRIRITKVKDGIPPDQITGEPDQREPVDLRTADQTWVELEIPKGKRLPLLPANIIDDINGLIEHVDTVGVFTVDGRWKIRGKVLFDSGNEFSGTWTGFLVGD